MVDNWKPAHETEKLIALLEETARLHQRHFPAVHAKLMETAECLRVHENRLRHYDVEIDQSDKGLPPFNRNLIR